MGKRPQRGLQLPVLDQLDRDRRYLPPMRRHAERFGHRADERLGLGGQRLGRQHSQSLYRTTVTMRLPVTHPLATRRRARHVGDGRITRRGPILLRRRGNIGAAPSGARVGATRPGMPTDNDPQISQIAVKDASPPLLPLRNLCNLRMVPTDALNMLPVGTVPGNRAIHRAA